MTAIFIIWIGAFLTLDRMAAARDKWAALTDDAIKEHS